MAISGIHTQRVKIMKLQLHLDKQPAPISGATVRFFEIAWPHLNKTPMTYKEIAEKVCYSPVTVRRHMRVLQQRGYVKSPSRNLYSFVPYEHFIRDDTLLLLSSVTGVRG